MFLLSIILYNINKYIIEISILFGKASFGREMKEKKKKENKDCKRRNDSMKMKGLEGEKIRYN